MQELALVLDFGGGSVLILLLTLFMNVEQNVAQATNLLFFVPSAIVSIIINSKKKLIHWKNAILIIILGIVGSIGGALVSESLPVKTLRKFFGIFLIFISIYEIFSYYKLYIKGKKRHNNFK